MALRAVLVFAQVPSDPCAALDSLVAKGSSGRLVWRKGSSLEQDLLSSSPVDFCLYTALRDMQSCEKALAVLHCTAEELEEAVETYSQTTRFTVVLIPFPFPPAQTHPLKPQQSYCFANGRDVSEQVNTEASALYIEYERNYTRKDWLETLETAKQEVGGCGVVLAEHYLQELGYRLGRCKKYGA